jgi:hypothetical protein
MSFIATCKVTTSRQIAGNARAHVPILPGRIPSKNCIPSENHASALALETSLDFSILAPESRNPEGRVALHSHARQLKTCRSGNFLDVVAHSFLGALDVYNLLPEYVFVAKAVKDSQDRLQQILIIGASERHAEWNTHNAVHAT